MKRFILSIAFIVLGGHVIAQDIITKKDATEIQAKVIKIGTTEIEYKRWNNLDGPIYTLPVKEVFTIKYENGQRDVFSIIDDGNTSRNKTNTYNSHYEGDVAVGYALGLNRIGEWDYIAVETVHGIRILPYLFVGGGLGLHLYYIDDRALIMPIYTNIKGYYPLSDKLSLSMSVDLGAAIGIYDIRGCHFYTSFGPGIQFGRNKSFDLSLRYQYIGLDALLVRFGYRF